MTLKSHSEWSNAQRISTPTTAIRLITVVLYIDLRPGQAVKIGNLNRGRVEWVRFVTPTERRWALTYHITGSQSVWRSDELETTCGRETQHPAEWALKPPIEQLQLEIRPVGDQTSLRSDQLEISSVGPRPPFKQPRRTGKKRCYGQ